MTIKALVVNSTDYERVHKMLRKERGSASEHICIECGNGADQWAYQRGMDPEDFDSYRPMCYRCHNLYDGCRERMIGHTHTQGIKHPSVKLSEEDVLEIRRKHADGGWTYRDLAYIYGVTAVNVSQIVRKIIWRHI